MQRPMPHSECRTRPRAARSRAFSFTEILFAVMILGIGFIMVAAMFPAAIHQTEANNQETITAAVGRDAYNYMTDLAALQLPTGTLNTTYTVAGNYAQTPSILLASFPNATLPTPSSYTLPPNQTTLIVPGQVWSMCDSRDIWTYTWKNPTTYAPQHNLALWQSISKNLIQADDARFAWPVMYRRDIIVRGSTAGGPGTSIAAATYAQVIVIGARCRNAQVYSPNVDIPYPPYNQTYTSGKISSLLPNLVIGAQLSSSPAGTSYVNFSNVNPSTTPMNMVIEGAYVVISDDNVPATTTATTGPLTGQYVHGLLNGRVFRLGVQQPGTLTWAMLPGSDMTTSDQNTLSSMSSAYSGLQFSVLVVGSGVNGTGWAGPAQDVSAYSTYVPVAN